ncbi:acyl-CoA--6-aminopenicillanic acid acyl-transferase [Myroides sp. 1354]|uniref:C45 family autoproteolytic acyltransferase/hydolase n=1 Tax=unclassified Myroides TaxID=2642485 RepID=UPI002576EDA2|nr:MULTISPECIES: C45 family autoproteolytic acyltransferase/hydolase [unclassified Myroides]MDM1043686.1 acyl-CoA--6-aminopenicillanic acid acyl-transferase [Myroides sp. R163-1]MDM1054264.1 acyl-CoA--6-aminopenicillanic acid acyl-transferase [Myroides sp. 1354]MDM1067560.1 acyl-CoA--6-aminopenicillanic acid acyl-transferase [Myroides sp. 1372]
MKHHIYSLVSVILLAVLVANCGIKKGLRDFPSIEQYDTLVPRLSYDTDSLKITTQAYLYQNKQKLWELYVQGDPYQIGLQTGALTQQLYQKQETVFFAKVEEFVPSAFKQKMLVKMLKFYNRHLYRYIPAEFKTEIYGLSHYATDRFAYLGDAYHRNLYLHGAHDIGHAFQDLALVGCSSLAVWGEHSEDGGLLIGRNFDFYAGDEFAENKIIAFVKPNHGHAFMSVTWGGMTGVVSGMNQEGLTVTLNAGKSAIPLKAKTPISVVAREILQYAANIEEAIAIAEKKEVFVSESILVGSAQDKKAVIIEIAPKNFGVYDMPNVSTVICSNHFQSEAFAQDKRNRKQIEESHSQYRWDKIKEIVDEERQLSPLKMAHLLRNTEGLDQKALGYGNEKALNQLLAHHGIIFQPEKRLVWVSSNPYQLGEFVAYDLNTIFSNTFEEVQSYAIDSLTISEDPFVHTQAYANYEAFRKENRLMEEKIKAKEKVDTATIKAYQQLNPDYWLVYYRSGVYYYNQKEYQKAQEAFEQALTKEVTTVQALEEIKKYLKKIKRKWN